MEQSIQRLLKGPGPLLNPDGSLADVGWARQPLLDCNLEDAHFFTRTFRQWTRIKRWDYYGITTPTHFFSFTISDIGYLGLIFAYVLDFETKRLHEETITIPLSKGVTLPRNSLEGESIFENKKVSMMFFNENDVRRLSVQWQNFDGQPLTADVTMHLPSNHESMVIVIPIAGKRFYYNRKINCIPAEGWVKYQGKRYDIRPDTSLANLDWGRGVWEYKSFWVWASASGFLSDRRTIGLNLGFGFGDTSAATENAFVINGQVHKLGQVDFDYDSKNFMRPWKMTSSDDRIDLVFTPFYERIAKTEMVILGSEVHQMFGHYSGTLKTDEGHLINVNNLTGWAEEHHARW